jgi:hypothetical protein
LAVAAKAGSRKAYVNLLGLAQTETETSDLLSASLKEIDLFYDADRNQLAFPILVETETLKDPGFSTDELVSVLRKKPQLAEAAVNSLSKLKSKAPVRELCTLVESTEDLRVATRATRALEQITGEKFRPLEFDKVRKWWEDNADNEVYLGNYNGYCYVVEKMFQGTISYEQLKDFVAKLCETADSDPKALHCQCLQAGFLIMLGRGDEAKSLFDEVRKEDQDYRWLHVWEAAPKIREGDQESALELLNKAFKKSPTSAVEETIKRWRIFDPIQNNEGLKWPSRESNAQQGAPTEAQ